MLSGYPYFADQETEAQGADIIFARRLTAGRLGSRVTQALGLTPLTAVRSATR